MEEKKEIILLDAVIRNAVDCAAFTAELANGHSIIAFTEPGSHLDVARLAAGVSVRVRMSPYDMSKGCIIGLVGEVES